MTQQTPRSVKKEGEEVAPGAIAAYGEDHVKWVEAAREGTLWKISVPQLAEDLEKVRVP